MFSTDNTYIRIFAPLIDGAVVAACMPLMGGRGVDMIIEHVEKYLQTLK